ncbi:MAG TPA: hypothetical protein VGK99_00155 [Acidobacteriota bacterium]|jgi:hypothetical protein
MAGNEKEMIREFFQIFPDIQLCHASAQNVLAGITSYQQARELMWKKAEGEKLNHDAIEQRLDSKKVFFGSEWKILKELSLHNIIHLPDDAFREALIFYVKHPYAHSRIKRSRLLPRFLRTFFLRQLIGQAMIRKLPADYDEMFELMSLL